MAGVSTHGRLQRGALPPLVLLLLLASACTQDPSPDPATSPATSPPATAAPTQSGGVFHAYTRQPASIDPGRALEAEDLAIVGQLFDSLTAIDQSLAVVPAAAERWESNEDSTVFTFYLREDATFHDGSPVLAADFKRAWDRVAAADVEPPSAAFYLLSSVQGFEEAQDAGELVGVEVHGDHALLVRLNGSFSAFPAVVSHPALAPVPPSAADSPDDYGSMPVGNGPFRMAEPWEPSGFIRLEPYPDHPDGPPRLDQLLYRSYRGENAVPAAYEDFLSGNLDLAPVPEDLLDEAVAEFGEADGGYEGDGVVNGAKLITAFYAFNTEVAPFDDPRIRRALSLLIDRQAIVTEVVDGARLPATSVVPPGIADYEPGRCGYCDYDPERAQALAGDLEFGPVQLYYYEGAEHDEVARRVQRDVNSALGDGTLELRAMSQSEWLEAIRNGEAGFFLYGWLAEYPSPDTFLYPLFHRGRVGADNVSRYTDDEVTDLLDRARREKDAVRRLELYREAESHALNDAPVAPLFHYRLGRVVADRVHGFAMDAMGYPRLTSVWVESRD